MFQMKTSLPLLLMSALLLLLSCENAQPNDHGLKFKDDSTQTTVLPEQGTQSTQVDTSHKAQGPAFAVQNKTLATTVLGAEYKEVGLDELEDSPKFKQAREMVFLKFIRRNPIDSRFAGQIIPRLVWKGYQFATESSATSSLEQWLNEANHSGDSIVMGEKVESIKLPPMVCAVVGERIYMLQTPCLYKGPEQDQLISKFTEETKKAGAKYRFRIACNGGQLTYEP
jgi:hypothetical protein